MRLGWGWCCHLCSHTQAAGHPCSARTLAARFGCPASFRLFILTDVVTYQVYFPVCRQWCCVFSCVPQKGMLESSPPGPLHATLFAVALLQM